MLYSLTVMAETPLSFREGRNTAETSTLSYIPGGTLLACLVHAHQRLRQNPAELNALFMQDATMVGNLYPANFADKPQQLQSNRLPVYPLPATARTCKRFEGFLFDAPQPDDHHSGQDNLLPWGLFALSEQAKIELLEQNATCKYQLASGQTCGESIDRLTGFYRRGKQPTQWGKSEVKHGLRTRTGINRATGAVEQGILYSRSMLAEGSSFWGTIKLADDQAATFETFLNEAGEAGLLRVGNNRTRGLGKIKATALEPFAPDTPTGLSQRISDFDTRLREMAQAEGIKTPHLLYLPLTLTSDVIVTDHLLRNYAQITPEYLTEMWDIQDAMLIYGSSSTHRVMGWNDLWRLPKADNLAIMMGSVFLFGLNRALDDNLLQKLLQMQNDGIGVRRREGFGQLTVANSFHWEVNHV